MSLGRGDIFNFLLSFFLSILVFASFVLLREGEKNHLLYKHSKYTKYKKYPLKLFGALSLSVATSISAFFGEYTLLSAVLFGILILTGWYFYYGFEIYTKNKKHINDKAYQRIVNLLFESKKKIKSIKFYAEGVSSKEISDLMDEMADSFLKIVKHIESEPQDYELFRKYLISYLYEIESMSKIFYTLEKSQKAKNMNDDFKDLLKQGIEKLNSQQQKLLKDDILDLDIKISVMKKRFQNEE